MEYLEDVQEARYYVDEAKKKLEIEETGINLDAAAEQDNADCQEEELELHPDYSHMDTEGIEIQEENENWHTQHERTERKHSTPRSIPKKSH